MSNTDVPPGLEEAKIISRCEENPTDVFYVERSVEIYGGFYLHSEQGVHLTRERTLKLGEALIRLATEEEGPEII